MQNSPVSFASWHLFGPEKFAHRALPSVPRSAPLKVQSLARHDQFLNTLDESLIGSTRCPRPRIISRSDWSDNLLCRCWTRVWLGLKTDVRQSTPYIMRSGYRSESTRRNSCFTLRGDISDAHVSVRPSLYSLVSGKW